MTEQELITKVFARCMADARNAMAEALEAIMEELDVAAIVEKAYFKKKR
jgi:hypothetical protein